MTAISRGTKFAIIFGVIGIVVGVAATLAFIQTDEGAELKQRLVGDTRESSEGLFLKVKGVVRPAIYHKSNLSPGEEGVFYADATGGTRPYKFQWDFGDGSAISPLENVTHSFLSAGDYKVQLTATDSTGRMGVISVTQKISPP
jgi:PKD domain-containing protein